METLLYILFGEGELLLFWQTSWVNLHASLNAARVIKVCILHPPFALILGIFGIYLHFFCFFTAMDISLIAQQLHPLFGTEFIATWFQHCGQWPSLPHQNFEDTHSQNTGQGLHHQQATCKGTHFGLWPYFQPVFAYLISLTMQANGLQLRHQLVRIHMVWILAPGHQQ